MSRHSTTVLADPGLERRIEAVRRFNRFYTRRIGVLREGLLNSPFSLTEARVLYELARHAGATASALSRELALDAGYLSRILRSFEERGLIRRSPNAADGRQNRIELTEAGLAAFAPLDQRSQEEVGAMLAALPEASQNRLVSNMAEVEALLGERAAAESYLLRPHRPGDLGWIVH